MINDLISDSKKENIKSDNDEILDFKSCNNKDAIDNYEKK